MFRIERLNAVIWIGICFTLGCGSEVSKFAPADGVLTVDGKPFPKATVTFLPEKGPVAIGITDNNGNFKLFSGGQSGVMIGPVTATVIAPPTEGENQLAGNPDLTKQPKTPAEAEAYRKKVNELQAAQNAKKRADFRAGGAKRVVESPIDLKYSKSATSGLSYTIKASGDNHFKIQL